MGKTSPSSVQQTLVTLIKDVAARGDLFAAHSQVVETLRQTFNGKDRNELERLLRRVLETRNIEALIVVLRNTTSSLTSQKDQKA
jgi:hypothetical protein